MYYVGLDVRQKRSSVCILDGHGKRVKGFEAPGGWDKLITALAQPPQPMAVCLVKKTVRKRVRMSFLGRRETHPDTFSYLRFFVVLTARS